MTATPNAQSPLVIQAKGLVKRYGQVTALDGADFELRAGEIMAVIGDNGARQSGCGTWRPGHPEKSRLRREWWHPPGT